MTWLLLLGLFTALGAFIAPATIGSGFINIGGFFIGIMSMLFDLALNVLIVKFEPMIYSAIGTQIGNVWTVFRDLANILIIGMLSFTAISMILGIESFNARKMVAKVLLIAVLINFSLLFTRLIISSSNFVAGQFYYAMALEGKTPTTTAVSGSFLDQIASHASQAGIGGQFMNLLGLPSAFKAYDTVNNVWKGNASAGGRAVGISIGGGIAAMIYSFTVTALMLATALVLAYAVFLIVVRTVLFLFLLSISALAFAAYLIPKWGDKYWSMWWDSLLRNAIFGPLLMMMLWATLTISYALVSGPGQSRSFDKLFTDPTAGSGVLAILVFLIIIGMLIASIRFASSFAKGIAGFNYASGATATPLALGARFAGFAGRGLIGGGFSRRSDRLSDEMSKTNTAIADLKPGKNFDRRKKFLESRLNTLDDKKRFADKIAGGKFSLADTKTGAKLMKAANVPQAVMGGGKGVVSYGEFQQKIVKEAAERAAAATKLSDKGADTIRASATAVLEKQKEVLQQNIEIGKTNMKAEEAARKTEIDKHEKDAKDARDALHQWDTMAPHGPTRDAGMNAEKVKIEKAKKEVDDLRDQFRKNAGLDVLATRMEELEKTIKNTGDLAVAEGKKTLNTSGEALAGKIAYDRPSNILPWATGRSPENDQTTLKARWAFKKKVNESAEDRLIERLRQSIGPSTPPTP